MIDRFITVCLEKLNYCVRHYYDNLCLLIAWNYNTNRNNMWENSFTKVYWIWHGFEVEHDLLQTKNRNISHYQITNLLKTWFLFLEPDNSEFLIKSIWIIIICWQLTSFYNANREIWLGNSKNLIYIDHQDSIFSHIYKNSKMFNIISKYFTFFNNKLPASWVAHITRDFLRCYSCSYSNCKN